MEFTKVSCIEIFSKDLWLGNTGNPKGLPVIQFTFKKCFQSFLAKSIPVSYILVRNCKGIGIKLFPALWKRNHFQQQRMLVMEHFKTLPGPGTAEMFSRSGILLNLTRRGTLRQRCRDAMASVGGGRGKGKTGSRTRSYFPLAGFRTIIWHPWPPRKARVTILKNLQLTVTGPYGALR